jgi:hypothetical protein
MNVDESGDSVYGNGAGGLASTARRTGAGTAPPAWRNRLDCSSSVSAELGALFASCQ